MVRWLVCIAVVAVLVVTASSAPAQLRIITGPGAGGGPHVRGFTEAGEPTGVSFLAYPPGFAGGVRVAMGDVNGDGKADIITAAGPGGGPHVEVFDGATGALIRSFFAYAPAFTGGVFVAAGDVNGDGKADIITAAGPGGGPHVLVFDGATGAVIRSFFAYAPAFTGGVFVAAGDVNGDGFADIVTGAGPGGGPHVQVFSGTTGASIRSFFAYAPAFTGGVRVAATDINGDGKADIITGAGPGGGPHVQVFDAVTGAILSSFFAYNPAFVGGIFVSGVPPPTMGQISIDVTCDGVGCGRSGNLRAIQCTSGQLVAALSGVTLLFGQTVNFGTPYPQTTGLCMRTFLDVDMNGILSPGDVIASAGDQTFDVGLSTHVSYVLDTMQP